LVAISEEELDIWIRVSQLNRDSEGFTNILCYSKSNRSILGWKDLPVAPGNALDLLFGDPLEVWNGRVCDHGGMGVYLYFRRGWEIDNSIIENEASILFKPTPYKQMAQVELRLQGTYAGDRYKMEIIVNDYSVGEHFLDDCVVLLPSSVFFVEKTIIVIARKNMPSISSYIFKSISWEGIKR
jgi:hypothetical protein